MPRFYFNVRNKERIADPEGTELPDLAAAEREARASAEELSALRHEWSATAQIHAIEIADEQGLVLAVIPVPPSRGPNTGL